MMRLQILRLAVVAIATAVVPVFAQESTHDQNRDKWQKVDEIFAAMGVKPGAVVADVGAGGGYFTTRLARAVGDTGRVYAVDIGADVVRRLNNRVSAEGLKNVEVIQGTAADPKLPAGSLDAALIVNAYHEMNEHHAMLAALRSALKPDGRLVIVEPISPSRRSQPRSEQTRNHEIGIAFVMEDARAAGFTHVQVQDPFTKRIGGHSDDEWILVLTPAPATEPGGLKPAPTETGKLKPAPSEPVETGFSRPASDEWKSPDLRISPEEFKRLADADVLVLDVRDPDSYRKGHLPGALLMTPEEISKPDAIAKLAREKRRIVTYCS